MKKIRCILVFLGIVCSYNKKLVSISAEDLAIAYAINTNNRNALELLVHEGVDLDAQDEEGRTALIYAAHSNKLKAVTLLLEYKVKSNIQDKSKKTALIWAACQGHRDIIERLLVYGADPTLCDANGWNFLTHFAFYHPKIKNYDFLFYTLKEALEAFSQLKESSLKKILHKYPAAQEVLIKNLIIKQDLKKLVYITKAYSSLLNKILDDLYFNDKFSKLSIYNIYRAQQKFLNTLGKAQRNNRFTDLEVLTLS